MESVVHMYGEHSIVFAATCTQSSLVTSGTMRNCHSRDFSQLSWLSYLQNSTPSQFQTSHPFFCFVIPPHAAETSARVCEHIIVDLAHCFCDFHSIIPCLLLSFSKIAQTLSWIHIIRPSDCNIK